MKTNVTLKSDDRVLFGHIIRQNTKDQMFSVSDLQHSYNFARFQYGWSERSISGIMRGKDFQERCYHLLNERGLVKVQINTFIEMIEREGVTKILKGLKVWKTAGRGENKSTFADPYIWVLLAMELNPLIYAKVVIWLTDSLIFNRVIAGDAFKPMTREIAAIVPNPDYALICRKINEKVFGYHEKDIRNSAAQDVLLDLSDFQKFITQSIKMRIVRDKDALFRMIDLYQTPMESGIKKFT